MRENTEWLISLDHDPPSLKNTNFDAGKQNARPLDVATVGMELLDVTPGVTPNVETSIATTGIAINGNRFVVTDRFDADGTAPGGALPAVDSALRTHSLRLAPILPGRYAVIGTAGAIYQETADQIDNNDSNSGGTFATDYELENRYTITLSRELSADTGSLDGPWGGLPREQDPRSVRRIEFMPDEDPSVHQVIVNRNGSFRDGIRSSEMLENNINLTNPNSDLGAYSFSPMIDPVVAIPIEGFSISEPLDGYYVRRSEILEAGGSGATGANPYGSSPRGRTRKGKRCLAVAPLWWVTTSRSTCWRS